jgi:hypothetical protein
VGGDQFLGHLVDVGNVAAFAASDLAATVTGTINMTAGAVLG